MDSVSAEGNVSDVNNRSAVDSNKLDELESHDKEAFSDRNNGSQKPVKRRKKSKSKESVSPAIDSTHSTSDVFAANEDEDTVVTTSMEESADHGFEVGDMVWGKVKSHPWWPGHVYSEEFATPAVRRLKREGLLLVAFFGDSSYGWFDPSELMPFDSNFEEKFRQTTSKTFIKAVEEAMDEVSKRSALGLSCMCRNKQNFRQTDVEGFLAVDVVDYDPGAVYSIDAIKKAREGFQPSSTLEFIKQLALEPKGRENIDINFIKNKARVISYRRAVYEEFDDTYAQAFGYESDRPSPGSVKELPSGRKPSKAPLSGRQVFADTSGKGKSSAKPNKPKENVKKDKYILKRRDESKDVKVQKKEKKGKVASSPQLDHVEDSTPIAADDYVLQKRDLETVEVTDTPIINDELPSKDATGDTPVTESVKDEEKKIVAQTEDKTVITQDDISKSKPKKKTASQKADNGQKKVKAGKRPAGEMGSELPEKKKKKRKKESLVTSDTNNIVPKEEEKLLPKKTVESPMEEDPQETVSGNNYNEEIQQALHDLHSLALDPLNVINKGFAVKTRKVFLRFRSVVFQKSLNSSSQAEDDGNDTLSTTKSSSENGGIKRIPSSAGRSDDPAKSGRKRGPSDRQEEMAVKKKKKVGDIKNLTKDKKVIKKIDESPVRDAKQAVVTTLKKSGRELVKKTEQRVVPEPTMLVMKFPTGGSLPSLNELKARFARYGPLDHSATRIYWKSFSCRLVYRYKSDAQAAYKFVVESGSLFNNSDVKCFLKEFGDSETPAVKKVVKEETSSGAHRPPAEEKPKPSSVVIPATPGVHLKSILKKSGGEESVGGKGNMPRVKFMLGGEHETSPMKKENKNVSTPTNSTFGDFPSSNATKMDLNSKKFQKAVLPQPPLLPTPTSVSSVMTSSSQSTKLPLPPPPPPPNSMHYGNPPPLGLAPPPPRVVAPPPGNFVHNLQRPKMGPPATPKVDISNQMISLMKQCNEVVTNVTNLLGYVPYHPL